MELLINFINKWLTTPLINGYAHTSLVTDKTQPEGNDL